MDEQLQLWGDDDEAADEEPFPTPPEPPPPTSLPATSLDRELELLFLDYLGRSAQRIATAVESSQSDRRAEFLRLINYHVAVGKLSNAQREMLQRIVHGQQRYV